MALRLLTQLLGRYGSISCRNASARRWACRAVLVLAVLASCTPMTPAEREAAIDGGVIGAVAGTYVAASTVLSQSAGGGGSSAIPWLAAGPTIGALAGAAAVWSLAQEWPALTARRAAPMRPAGPLSLVKPRAGQFELQVENLSGFTGPGSIVRVREFRVEGTGLHFNDLGIHNQQLPSVDARYWFNDVSAIHFRFRYFYVEGTHFLSHPANFNGATIAPGQTIHTRPDWYSGGLYYERRLAPWYADYENGWPALLRGWDLRAKVGIEFTYLNFVIDGGRARVTSSSKRGETKEDFYHQSMPLPTIGLQAWRQFGSNFEFEGSVEGNWINRWNSLRDEGGIIWAAQNGVEAHLRVFYFNPAWFGALRPMLGVFFYHYSQLEDSSEDGNFVRWSSYGPEAGLSYSF